MHVVQLLAPQLDHEDHTKDVDFSPTGFTALGRRVCPHQDRARAQAWVGQFDPLSGVILHEAEEFRALAAE